MDALAAARLGDAAEIELSLTQPERFAAIFDRHAARVHRYAARRLGVSAADDIVAEVFLIAFRQRAGYDTGQPSARPWLYGIATNLISRHRRSELRMLRALARTGVDPVLEPEADRVATAVSAAAVARQVADALTALSERDRHTLLLFAWAELSYDEIAAALDLPVGTVRSRLHRAGRSVRAAVGDANPLDAEEEPGR